MEITVVGSGTVVPEGDRVCSSYFVDLGDTRLLLDCGAGAIHHLARFDLPWSRLTHLILSHFHTDHIGGLPMLLFSLKHALRPPRTEPLVIAGPVGTASLLDRLADAFGDYIHDPGFPLDVRELGPENVLRLDGELRLRAHPTPHTDESVAYRLEAPAGALGYTGDTGASGALGEFFRGVDVLIAECSLPADDAIESHLTPARVAALARAAAPGRLVPTHVFPLLDRAELPDRIRAAGWDGEVWVANDGMRITI